MYRLIQIQTQEKHQILGLYLQLKQIFSKRVDV